MNGLQTVGIRFFHTDKTSKVDYVWRVFTIPVGIERSGKLVTHLNLDHIFRDRKTSIRFKGYTPNGRPLYMETNLERKVPQESTSNVDYYYMEDIKKQNTSLNKRRPSERHF